MTSGATGEDLDDIRVQPEQIIDLGDRVALRIAMVGRGLASGVPTSRMIGTIYYFSPGGMVARQDFYWSWKEALDALNDHGEAVQTQRFHPGLYVQSTYSAPVP